jgi:hypothetical protein
MAELPRMVMALKGSPTLRMASHAFSVGVIGLTFGPLRKRAYQLMMGGKAGQGAACALGWELTLGVDVAAPEAAGAEAVSAEAAPDFFTLQGAGGAVTGWSVICGWGASGSVGAGWGLSV